MGAFFMFEDGLASSMEQKGKYNFSGEIWYDVNIKQQRGRDQ